MILVKSIQDGTPKLKKTIHASAGNLNWGPHETSSLGWRPHRFSTEAFRRLVERTVPGPYTDQLLILRW